MQTETVKSLSYNLNESFKVSESKSFKFVLRSHGTSWNRKGAESVAKHHTYVATIHVVRS